MINKIQEALKHEEHAMGVFLDIQGAFDNIPIQSIKRALNKTSAKGMVAPGQYRKKNVVYLGEKCSGFYQPKGDFYSL